MEVDYLKQMNAYFDRLGAYSLSPEAQALYLQIFNIQNRSFWADKIRPSVRILAGAANISESQFYTAREELVEGGYIAFNSVGGSAAGEYSIIILYGVTYPSYTASDEGAADPQEKKKERISETISDEHLDTSEAMPRQRQDNPKTISRQSLDKSVKKSRNKNINYNINKTKRERDETPPRVTFFELPKPQQEAINRLKELNSGNDVVPLDELRYPPDYDYIRLLSAVKASPQFLQENANMGLLWLLKPEKRDGITNYERVCSGYYNLRKDRNLQTRFKGERKYTEEWEAMIDDITLEEF